MRTYCASETTRRVIAEQTVRRESPFSMQVGGRFLLTGSIDLYARTGNRALVVDYKSGQTGDAKQLERRYELQAECYALAVLGDGCESVEVEFVRPEVEMSGGVMQCARFAFSASDSERIETGLLRRYADIESSPFDPAPSDECSHCDVPVALCPVREQMS